MPPVCCKNGVFHDSRKDPNEIGFVRRFLDQDEANDYRTYRAYSPEEVSKQPGRHVFVGVHINVLVSSLE